MLWVHECVSNIMDLLRKDMLRTVVGRGELYTCYVVLVYGDRHLSSAVAVVEILAIWLCCVDDNVVEGK